MLNFKLIIRLLSLFNYFKLLEFDSVTLKPVGVNSTQLVSGLG